MKILIDTEGKTIKLEENVNLEEFTKKIKNIVPDWKEYDLLPSTITGVSSTVDNIVENNPQYKFMIDI